MPRLHVFIFCIAMTLAACRSDPHTTVESTRARRCADCNVILVSMDTVRADHLGAYGYSRPTSPNFDAFAKRSVLFERAVFQAAWTLPGHASMMTGLYPGELGLRRYPAERTIPARAPMLAEAFRAAGYATGAQLRSLGYLD